MSVLVLDTETSGISNSRPVQIAYYELGENINDLSVLSKFSKMYNPECPISIGAMAACHILDSDVADSPSYTEFKFPDNVSYVVGHNIDFDCGVLGLSGVKRIDNLALARKYIKGLDSYSQNAVAYYIFSNNRLKIRDVLKNAHSAEVDVYVCHIVLKYLIKLINPVSWEDLYLKSEAARIPEEMPFGKYKGKSIAEIDLGYKLWLLKLPDLDVYLKKAVENSMSE